MASEIREKAERDEGRSFWLGQLQKRGAARRDLLDALLFERGGGQEPASVRRPLSDDARLAVRRIAGGSDIGVFTVVLAAVATLVGRYSGDSTVALEIPSRGGCTAEEEPCVALLAIVACPSDGSFRDLLVETQRVVTGTYRYQSAFTDAVSEASAIASSDVLVACRPLHDGRGLGGAHALRILVHSAEAIELELASPAGVLPPSFLAETANLLDALIASFASLATPFRWFAELVATRSAAKVAAFNRTDTRFPSILREARGVVVSRMTVVDLVNLQAELRPEARAVVCGAATLSYRELNDEANRLAALLLAVQGVARGITVAAVVERSQWTVVSMLAIMKAGAVFLPLNPQTTADRMRSMLTQTEACALLAPSSRRDLAPTLDGVAMIVVDADDHLPCAHETSPPPPPPPPPLPPPSGADVAYIIYTSGSTGTPKGVVITHDGLANTILDHIDRFRLVPTDRYLQFLALSFDGALLDVFMTLCAGATLVVAEDGTIADPARLMAVVSAEEISISTMTPSYLKLLDPDCLARLRLLVSAGEVLSPDLAARYANRLELYNGYGPTECAINSSLHRVRSPRSGALVPIGGPSANKRIRVVDAALAEQPVGVVGELCIGGKGLALGYVKDEDLTREKFIGDAATEGGRWYRTGDFGAWTERGEILYRGRTDSQVKVNGYRIDLSEIQAALEAAVRSRHSLVLTRTGSGTGLEVVAFYQEGDGARLDPAQIRALLARSLPAYMLPHHVVRVGDWPLTPHGKTDTVKLLAAARDSELGSTGGKACPPAGDTETAIYCIWKEVLGRDDMGADESFFHLGGDSIRVIQAAYKAKERGLAVAASDIFTQPTIRDLARLIDARARDRAVQPESDDTIPLDLTEPSASEKARMPSGVESAYLAAQMQSLMIERYAADRMLERTYLGCAEWRFEDPSLSEEALVAAIQLLVERNRTLRSYFLRGDGGRDLLLVRAPAPVRVKRTDLRSCLPADLDAFFWARIADEALDRFDPYSDEPLVRFHLYRTGDTRCSLFVSFHHSILDGWSGIELRNTLLEHYAAAKASVPSSALTSGSDSYREFVALEQAVLRSPEAAAFWQKELCSAGAARARALFAACTTSAPGRAPDRDHLDLELAPDALCASLAAAKHDRVPLKAVFLAAVAEATIAALRLPNLVVGVVSNGRSERLASPFRSTGLFWNILPVHTPPAHECTSRRLDARLREVAAHGSFPLKAMEDRITGEPIAMPIFNFVQFHNASDGAARFREGIVQSRFDFPLTIFIKARRPSDGDVSSIALRVEFDAARIARRDVAEILSGTVTHLTSLRERSPVAMAREAAAEAGTAE